MEIVILSIAIFCIGAVFGSFFTLAVYRIPLHLNITHERSYCPKCNHKLSFWDMIPILSYLFLGGKCRYCKEKIRPRYFILEITSGIVFLLFALSMRISFPIVNLDQIVYLIFGLLFIAGLIIIAGIDKEKTQVSLGVILYEIIIVSLYMMYLYILGQINIYRYAIYLFVMLIFLVLNIIYFKKNLKNNYIIGNIMLCIIMACFNTANLLLISVILTLLAITLEKLLEHIKRKKKHIMQQENKENVPVAFYLCISQIITMIVINFITNGRW